MIKALLVFLGLVLIWEYDPVDNNQHSSEDNEKRRSDLALLALVIWREARGEGVQGMRAVGWSIRNRVTKGGWWGNTYQEVILKPWQYTSMTPAAGPAPDPNPNDTSWIVAQQTAVEVYDGIEGTNPIDGATHYYATYIAAPDWVNGAQFITALGGHRFYIAA